MKIEIGSYEAKTKLPELLRQVKTGKSFTITNRGEAIADLVPSAGVRTKDKVAAAEKLRAFMLADPVRGVNIKALGRASDGGACSSAYSRCFIGCVLRIGPRDLVKQNKC